jgi:hypothetical protein
MKDPILAMNYSSVRMKDPILAMNYSSVRMNYSGETKEPPTRAK